MTCPPLTGRETLALPPAGCASFLFPTITCLHPLLYTHSLPKGRVEHAHLSFLISPPPSDAASHTFTRALRWHQCLPLRVEAFFFVRKFRLASEQKEPSRLRRVASAILAAGKAMLRRPVILPTRPPQKRGGKAGSYHGRMGNIKAYGGNMYIFGWNRDSAA